VHANGNGRLFSPLRLGGVVLPNRIVMAPMTRSRASAEGVPGPLAATYYAQRASAGLIITEAAHVTPEGVGYPNTPGIHTDRQVAGWRNVTRAVHREGGRIFLQLWHVGRVSHPCMQPSSLAPVAPSAVAAEGQLFTAEGMQQFLTPRALEIGEIPRVVEQFARAARMARDAGFDGVDIHAANGYLIDQFLRDGSNHRTDGYGGSIANRARFLVQVTEAVIRVWGADCVGVRLSPLSPYNSMRDSNPMRTFTYVADALRHLGVGYLHVAEPGPGHPMATPAGCRLLAALRAAFPGCFVVDGGRDRGSAEAAVTAADADLVALATPFISNPDLVERLARGIPLTVADPKTFYEGGERGYTDYPTHAPLPGERSTHAVMNG
jgi:N-ethylmaleimide reductase